MYERFKSLGAQSLIFGIGGVLNQFVSIILVPVYTRYLTPEDYGVVQLLIVTSAFVVIVAQLGLSSAIFKSTLYDESKDPITIYSTAFYVLVISAVLMVGIGVRFAGLISQMLFATPMYARLVAITFATVALDTATVVPMARLRIEQKAWHYSIVNFCSFFCRLLLNVLFIVVWRRGSAGLVEANGLQSLLFVFIYIWLIKDQLAARFSKSELLSLLGFGLPLVPALISSRILAISDRYILNYYTDLGEVGLYSLGYRIAGIVSITVAAFQTAWPAVFFSAGRHQEAKQFYARVMTFFLFLNTFLSLGLSVLAEDILRVLSASVFHPAYRVVPLLALSYVFYGAYFVASTGIQLEKKNHYVALIAGAAALLQIGLNFLVIPHIGMMGAALNTAISYLVMPVIVIVVSRRFYPVPYEYKRIGKMALVAVAIYWLSRLFHIENSFVSFFVRGLLAVSFPFVLGLLSFYTVDEKKRIRQLLKQGWQRSYSFLHKRSFGKL